MSVRIFVHDAGRKRFEELKVGERFNYFLESLGKTVTLVKRNLSSAEVVGDSNRHYTFRRSSEVETRDADGETSVTWATFLGNLESGKWVYSNGIPNREQGSYLVTVPEKSRGVRNSADRTLRVNVPMTAAETRANETKEAEKRLAWARSIRERRKTGDAKWTGTYEAVVKGKKRTVSGTVEASDAYEAGDRLRAKFEREYGTDYIHPVAKFAGGPKRLDPGSISNKIARRAGPEEDE